MNSGTEVHNLIHDYFMSGKTILPDLQDNAAAKYWNSVKPLLDAFDRVDFSETAVINPSVGYAGTADCIARIDDQRYIIDWKTSSKDYTKETELPDYCMQVSAYASAFNADPTYARTRRVHGAAIVRIYLDQPATIYFLTKDEIATLSAKFHDRVWQFHDLFGSLIKKKRKSKKVTSS
eukprot:Colp12_sorted_trinity150504_noHs@28624